MVFSSAEPNVNTRIEEKRTNRQGAHLFFARARPKTSSGPPSFRKLRSAARPVSTASRSSTARRTASELLRDWRALRRRRIFPVSSRRFVRVNAALLMPISFQCVVSLVIIHNILLYLSGELMEARVGIEPTNEGFADLSLPTWVPRLGRTV